MKRILFITICLILAVSFLYSQSEKIKLAVSSFCMLNSEAEKGKAGDVAALYIENEISGHKQCEIRKKSAIADCISKLEKINLGLEDPAVIQGVGRSLKINYLMVGSVASYGQHSEVDSRLVNINNWHIVYARGESSSSVRDSAQKISSHFITSFSEQYVSEKEKADEKNPAISVYSFKGDNIEALKSGCGGVFSEILNSELCSVNDMAIVERTHSKLLINEKAMEMAGIIENDRSNEYFKVKGITYKVGGSIRVFKDLICLNYSITDTASGKLVYSGYNEIGSLTAFRPFAKNIARSMGDSLGNKTGTLDIKSDPGGADILIDDEVIGKTPTILQVKKGGHSLKLALKDYYDYEKNIKIQPRTVARENISLKKDMRIEEEARKHEAEEKARQEAEKQAEIDKINQEREAAELKAKAEQEAEANKNNPDRKRSRAGTVPTL